MLTDELWVIVVADIHNERQFIKWNKYSPENVLVIDYKKLERFLNGFEQNIIPFEIPDEKLLKLKALAECTFDNKDEIKKRIYQGKQRRTKRKSLLYF